MKSFVIHLANEIKYLYLYDITHQPNDCLIAKKRTNIINTHNKLTWPQNKLKHLTPEL